MNRSTSKILFGAIFIGTSAFCKYLGSLDQEPISDVIEIVAHFIMFAVLLTLCAQSTANVSFI